MVQMKVCYTSCWGGGGGQAIKPPPQSSATLETDIERLFLEAAGWVTRRVDHFSVFDFLFPSVSHLWTAEDEDGPQLWGGRVHAIHLMLLNIVLFCFSHDHGCFLGYQQQRCCKNASFCVSNTELSPAHPVTTVTAADPEHTPTRNTHRPGTL